LDVPDFEKRKLEDLKDKNRLVDARPMIKMLLKPELDPDVAVKAISDGFEAVGNSQLERAFIEGDLSEKEWDEMKAMGFEIKDMAAVLGAYYGTKDKQSTDEIVIVSVPSSAIIKNNDFVKKRFGIRAITAAEAVMMMKKEEEKGGL
jgi:hypothetical protein